MALAKLSAVEKGAGFSSRQVLGRRLGECQFSWGGECRVWHQNPEVRAPGLSLPPPTPHQDAAFPITCLLGPHLP